MNILKIRDEMRSGKTIFDLPLRVTFYVRVSTDKGEQLNGLDSDSEFRLVVMAGVAQNEVRKLSERLKFGFRQAIKSGHVLGNDKLWGYDKKDCALTINEREAQVVRRIFDLSALLRSQ